MDATERPVKIRPEFANYAETHGIFELYKRLLSELIINKPDDPLTFMIEYLKKDDNDLPQIMVLGPPESGKHSISSMLCKSLGTALITTESVMSEPAAKTQVELYAKRNETIPADIWAKLVQARLNVFDAARKGWVMVGIPETAEQQKALSELGIYPKHCVILDAPDMVLIERRDGKRFDPSTGDVYHVTFDWPIDAKLMSQLKAPPTLSTNEMINKLVSHHRNMDGVRSRYESVCRVINADQPKSDVFSQVMTFVCQPARSAAPHTPRIVLLGATGSGKGLMATLLARKYRIVNVSCGHLLKEAVAINTSTGQACKSFIESGIPVPDALVLEVLKDRLSQLDASSNGWVLHGYPLTRQQAEQLSDAGYAPNRVISLDISADSIAERLAPRAVDPITGERFHLLYNPPRTHEIKDRLKFNPKDSNAEIDKRVTNYRVYVDDIFQYYSGVVQRVNADQEAHSVFEAIESIVVNPVPKSRPPPPASVQNHVSAN